MSASSRIWSHAQWDLPGQTDCIGHECLLVGGQSEGAGYCFGSTSGAGPSSATVAYAAHSVRMPVDESSCGRAVGAEGADRPEAGVGGGPLSDWLSMCDQSHTGEAAPSLQLDAAPEKSGCAVRAVMADVTSPRKNAP